jgi:3-methyladenine DNA glycosylase/8-oxoguanine DNA glycosylase
MTVLSDRPRTRDRWPPRERRWSPGRPVDVARTLGPLRRGTADPAHSVRPDGFWWAAATPVGPGTLRLRTSAGNVDATAWGSGADWLLERVPTLLGVDDDWSTLDVSGWPLLARVLRSRPGIRLPRTELVLDSLVPAILEQRVTGLQARRAWRLLLHKYGEPAPGPAPVGLRVPPTPAQLLAVPTWDWSRWEVDLHRRRAIRAVATVANRLEECARMSCADAARRLQLIPGIGIWTAAETTQRVLADPDTVSVNDYHVHNQVVFAFTGRARGTDEEMLELLEPWAGQRQRIVRLIELAGIGAPRFGPRQSLDRPPGS